MSSAYCLGLDAGGSATRYALYCNQRPIAEGCVDALTGLMLGSEQGTMSFNQVLQKLRDVLASHVPQPESSIRSIAMGLTGVGHRRAQAQTALSQAFPAAMVQVLNDVEVGYRSFFTGNEGYLVYAGTGSVGAWLDDAGSLQLIGGRGVNFDDAGGGYWIAAQALRHIWRQEDLQPGWGQQSLLGQAVFKAVGGSDWSASNDFFHQQSRGEVAQLALSVAQACHAADPDAISILQQAGRELARLGNILGLRFGAKPIACGGRAWDLHPLIRASFVSHLDDSLRGFPEVKARLPAHHCAAQIAFNSHNSLHQGA